MITIGAMRLQVIDYDPNGIISGASGDIAVSIVLGVPSIFLCQGGTVWSLL